MLKILSFLFMTFVLITNLAAQERVTVYTKFPPGDVTNILAGTFVKELNKQYLGIYDFRLNYIPGAGGDIADKRALEDAKLGLKSLVASSFSNFTVNPVLYDSKIDKDIEFVPLELAHRSPVVVAVNPETNINDMKNLIDYLKNKKTAYTGVGLNSTSTVLLNSVMKRHYQLDNLEIIRYKSQPEISKNLLGREIDYAILTPFDVSDSLKVLMVSSSEKTEMFPNIPTGIESGIPEFEYSTSMMLYAPTSNLKFAESIKESIHKICIETYSDKEMLKRIKVSKICNNDESWLRKEIEREKLLVEKHKDSLK
jgi:tripartite-type tricarboxylate transporter receptor subunit TctC